jgi:hypothetical protein
MTPKEKAENLINKFRLHSRYWDCRNDEPLEENHAKQCALIAVDEILIEIRKIYDIYTEVNIIKIYQYWQDVKTEIEKL